jgi:hypothetical protein
MDRTGKIDPPHPCHDTPDVPGRMVGWCRCGLPTDPPEEIVWWRADRDDEPGPPVCVVSCYGQDPQQRRAVRRRSLRGDAGWSEYGALVTCDPVLTPPLGWDGVGRCWAGTYHPIVAVTL